MCIYTKKFYHKHKRRFYNTILVVIICIINSSWLPILNSLVEKQNAKGILVIFIPDNEERQPRYQKMN